MSYAYITPYHRLRGDDEQRAGNSEHASGRSSEQPNGARLLDDAAIVIEENG